MEFQVWIDQDRESILALQRVAGKTTRKWAVRISRGVDFLFSALFLCQAALLLWLGIYGPVTIAALAIGVLTLMLGICYYRLAAWRSRKMTLRGGQGGIAVFREDGVYFTNDLGTSSHPYDILYLVCRYRDYFVLFLDKRHAFVVNIDNFTTGSPADFRPFLEEKTGKPIQFIK